MSPVTDIGAHQASRVPRVWPPMRCDIRSPSPVFEGGEHQWTAQEGPQTDRARAMVKAFIARHVNKT